MVFMVRQRTVPKTEIQFNDIPFSYTDDECVERLATIIRHRDSRDLSELSRLIGRLAIQIE